MAWIFYAEHQMRTTCSTSRQGATKFDSRCPSPLALSPRRGQGEGARQSNFLCSLRAYETCGLEAKQSGRLIVESAEPAATLATVPPHENAH